MENKEEQPIINQDKDSMKKVLVVLIILVVILSGALSFVIVKTNFLYKYLPDTSSECLVQIQKIEETLKDSYEILEWKKDIVYSILTSAKMHGREGREATCSSVVTRALDRLNSL